MALDFEKLGGSNSADTVISARELFSVLPNKAKGYTYLRDVQAEVLEQWFPRRGEKDLIIKMNTGSGKTVVGLLILKSCLNEKMGPAVYFAPDKYLVKQVIAEAAKLGIEVTEDPNAATFRRGQAILVANIFKLVNGRSVFGVAQEGIKIEIGSLIIDDAHACLSSTETQFTLKIASSNPAYKQLFALFRDSLYQQSSTAALEVENHDPTRDMLVPFWSWAGKRSEVDKILYQIRNESEVQFIWPLIKDNLDLCRCVFGGGEVEISPRCLPIDAIPSFVAAKRRIFMSATLSNDGILISDFDVSLKAIGEFITPKNANDIGDRMILTPQELNTDTTDDDIKAFLKILSTKYNIVVIVPSQYRANYWKDAADKILTADNLYSGVDLLKSGHVGLVVMINKYDGVDLPGDACRILVIDGLPDVRRRIDKIEQTYLKGSDELLNRHIQRIEQGMGRGVRSNDDQCIVFLMGAVMTHALYNQNAMAKFTAATRAQLDLSAKVADQIRGKGLKELTGVMAYSLNQDPKWVKASKSALVHIKYSPHGTVTPFVINQRKAFDKAQIHQFKDAADIMQEAVTQADDTLVKGWLKQQLAEYVHFIDEVAAQEILKSAITVNRYILKPIEGITYSKLITPNMNQYGQAAIALKAYKESPNKLTIALNALMEELEFIPGTASRFEFAFASLAKFLGFNSQRPEQETGKGPDVLWEVGQLRYFVIECKNGATTDTICKADCNQLGGSVRWFQEKYDTSCSCVPISIHPSSMFEYAATPPKGARVMTTTELSLLRDAIRAFAKAVISSNCWDDAGRIGKQLEHFSLSPGKFIDRYTVAAKVSKRS